MPADWADLFGRDFFGRVRYRRTFQKPTGLESGERVFLVVEPPRSRGVVSLSGKPLGEVVWGGPPAASISPNFSRTTIGWKSWWNIRCLTEPRG